MSRIEVTEQEAEELAKDLEAILGYVDTLKELDVSQVKEVSHLPYFLNSVRQDEAPMRNKDEATTVAVELLEAAPEKEDGYVKVRSILGKEL